MFVLPSECYLHRTKFRAFCILLLFCKGPNAVLRLFLPYALYGGYPSLLSVRGIMFSVLRFPTLCSLYSRDPFRCSAFLFFCFFTFVLSLRYDPFPMVRVLRSEGFCVCAVFAPCGAGVCVRSFDIHGLLFYCLSLGRLVFGVLEALLLRVGLSILSILKLCF